MPVIVAYVVELTVYGSLGTITSQAIETILQEYFGDTCWHVCFVQLVPLLSHASKNDHAAQIYCMTLAAEFIAIAIENHRPASIISINFHPFPTLRPSIIPSPQRTAPLPRKCQGYLTHGRIDGPVPPKKQKEFEAMLGRN